MPPPASSEARPAAIAVTASRPRGELASTQEQSPAGGGDHATELAFLNSVEFKRRFVESYASETDVEPRPTLVELEKLQKAVELIAADRLDDAAKLLADMRGPAATAVVDYTLANVYFQQKRVGPATTACRAAVAKFPRFRRAWRNLGVCYVREGDFERALPALTKVVELGGADPATYGLLGYGRASIGNDVAAESAYRMAMLLDPETVDFEMGRVRALFMQRRYAEAVALCDRSIAERPDSADLWLFQANAYIGANQPLRAAENYERVDRLGASTTESPTNLGHIYVDKELFEPAVEAYVSMAQLLVTQRKYEEALRKLKRAQDVDPRDNVQDFLDQVESAAKRRWGSISRARPVRHRGERPMAGVWELDHPLSGDLFPSFAGAVA